MSNSGAGGNKTNVVTSSKSASTKLRKPRVKASGGKGGWDKMTQAQKSDIIGRIDDPDNVAKPQDGDLVFKRLDISKIDLPDNIEQMSDGGGDVDDEDEQRPGGRKGRGAKSFEVIISLGNDKMKVGDIRHVLKHEYAARYLERLGVTPTPANMAMIEKHAPIEQCIIQQVFQPGLSKSERKNFISIRPGNPKTKQLNHLNLGEITSLHDASIVPYEEIPAELLKGRRVAKAAQKTKQQGEDAQEIGLEENAKSIQTTQFEEYKERYVFPYNIPAPPPPPSSKASKGTTLDKDVNLTKQRTVTTKREARTSSLAEETSYHLKIQDILLGKLKGLTPDEVQQLHLPGEVSGDHALRVESLVREGMTDEEVPEATRTYSRGTAYGSRRSREGTSQSARSGDAGRVEIEHIADLDVEDVTQYVEAFLSDFPVESLWPEMKGHMEFTLMTRAGKDRYPDGCSKNTKHVIDTMRFLHTPDAAKFVTSVVQLMFLMYLTPLCRTANVRRSLPEERDSAFVDVYAMYLSLMKSRMASRYGIALDCPLLLLMLRVVLESVIRALYPSWYHTLDGSGTTSRMDLFLTTVFDPAGFNTHISVLESSTAAMSVLHRKKVPRRLDLSYTSPLTRFIVGEAQSKQAQSFVMCRRGALDGSEELARMLTPGIRVRLLKVLAERKLQ